MRRHLIVIALLVCNCYMDDPESVTTSESEPENEINIERVVMTKVLKIKEYPFYWVSDSGSVQGFHNGELIPVEFKAEKFVEGVKTVFDIKPKTFFSIGNSIYFSADFQETENDETVTVERYFQQVKADSPVEIETLPAKPTADFFIGSDGRYDLRKNQYQDIFVSDIFQLASGRFNRHLKVSNYFYLNGAWIDVQEGLPGVREAGLYFWADSVTMLTKKADKGRMWIY
jgi:hypothetical protein